MRGLAVFLAALIVFSVAFPRGADAQQGPGNDETAQIDRLNVNLRAYLASLPAPEQPPAAPLTLAQSPRRVHRPRV